MTQPEPAEINIAADLSELRVPHRERLPDTRRSITHKFNVSGHKGYITVGLYDDGRPGEIYIKVAKEGSTMSGLLDSFGIAISLGLQFGVPIAALVRKFEHQKFEPSGWTTNPQIPEASSLIDYIFRWLGLQFSEEYRQEHARHMRETEPS